MPRRAGLLAIAGLVLACSCASVPQTAALTADGVNVPQFEASARCPDLTPDLSAFDRDSICRFVEETKKDRLTTPPGARIYREKWSTPSMANAGHGSITLTIYPDGRSTLTTPWRRGAYTLKPGELADFESKVAASTFGRLPVFVEAPRVCTGGGVTSLEAIVDGKYRLVSFGACEGVRDETLAEALDELFLLAAGLSGLKHPFLPERPTFRGF